MQTLWWVLGTGGAAAALGIFAVQMVMWRRTTDPVSAFTGLVAVRLVGGPLAVTHAAGFLVLAVLGRPIGWWIGALFTVAFAPVRRLLNLKAFSVIVRCLEYEQGPVVDRGGAQVARLPYWQLVARWHRHEYSGSGVGNVVMNKYWASVAALFCWPLVLLGAQVSHVLMCQEPCNALGHETDEGERPGDALRRIGLARLLA
jgi:hypothetical protein